METGLLQYEWSCTSCGQENHYENNEALTVMGTMRPEDLRK
jgi:hypothetical protein